MKPAKCSVGIQCNMCDDNNLELNDVGVQCELYSSNEMTVIPSPIKDYHFEEAECDDADPDFELEDSIDYDEFEPDDLRYS